MTLIEILAILGSLIIAWLVLKKIIIRKLRKKKTEEMTKIPFMHDKYPYERHWVLPEDDSEFSEAEGFESSAEMDLEDEEDN